MSQIVARLTTAAAARADGTLDRTALAPARTRGLADWWGFWGRGAGVRPAAATEAARAPGD